MIITRTPFRMSFFGGGTDFKSFYEHHGGAVISTTFDKYCYVSVRHLPPFFDYSSQISYSKLESVKEIDEIEHPLIREAMRYLDMHDLRISYDADLPASSGLGTSSSFAVGLLNAFYQLKGKKATKKKLADEAIYVERVLCNEAGGEQDQIAAAFGGMNLIRFNADGYTLQPILIDELRKSELNSNFLMFFTGFTRKSAEFAILQEKSIKKDESQLLETLEIVEEAYDILISQKPLIEFGKLLDDAWSLKRSFHEGITTQNIDFIYERAKSAGAVGGKLLGAGGGGFFLLYVEQDAQDSVREALSDLLEIPFCFEEEGAQTLYAEAEDWPYVYK